MIPFAVQAESQVGTLGESKLIGQISAWLGVANPPEPFGIGDDCCVFKAPQEASQLATTDPVIYGKHFDDSIEPEEVGKKLLNRNLSDIAAMGGIPTIAVISLCLPANTSINWLRRFYKGLATSAIKSEVSISGGDISQTDTHLGATLTQFGYVAQGDAILKRHRAMAGDSVFVTGKLGGSILGKHASFQPRLAEGQWLSKQPYEVSCLDLSDGIGKDGNELAKPGLCATIDTSLIPISSAAQTLSQRSRKPSMYHAINDGEDFELLFALNEANAPNFVSDWKQRFETPLTRIGKIRPQLSPNEGPMTLFSQGISIERSGYEHFRTT